MNKEHSYPLMTHVRELFASVDLSDVLLISCQHLLGSQLHMFEGLLHQGLQPKHCFIIGKNYSTNVEVYAILKKFGCYVDESSVQYEPQENFDSWFEKKIKEFLLVIKTRVGFSKFKKIIVLDDGGMLISLISKEAGVPLSSVEAIEQTSSGWHLLKDKELGFPVLYVARLHTKLIYETPYITKLCFDRIKVVMEKKFFEPPRVLVVGADGHLGKSLIRRFGSGGYRVKETDVSPQWIPISQVLREVGKNYQVIVGAIGSSHVSEELLGHLHPQAILISVSSSDREFPALAFRKDPKKGIHDDHYLGDRCLVNSGFPITFYGNYHEAAPAEIEITIAMLLFGVLRAAAPDGDDRKQNDYFGIILNRLTMMFFNKDMEV